MKTIILIGLLVGLCLSASAEDIQISWRVDESAAGVRVDVRSEAGEVVSHTYGPAVTNATLTLDAGDYLVTAVALGNTQWITNAQTGAVWSTNVVINSAASHSARIKILPPPEIRVFLQSADSVNGEWTDMGMVVSHVLESKQKYVRAVIRNDPLPPQPMPPMP